MQRILIGIGVVFLLVGLTWPWLTKLRLGRLPGDIYIQRDGFTFIFPFITGLIVSVVITLLVWAVRKWL